MKAVKRIAGTGRTVLCTIHQPSEEVFLLFDRLLLLMSGGKVVYNGPLGHNGNTLVKYFEKASGNKEHLGTVQQGKKKQPSAEELQKSDGGGQSNEAEKDHAAEDESDDKTQADSEPKQQENDGLRNRKSGVGSKDQKTKAKSARTVRINPANWMLDLVGGTTGSHIDYSEKWQKSEMQKKSEEETEKAAEGGEDENDEGDDGDDENSSNHNHASQEEKSSEQSRPKRSKKDQDHTQGTSGKAAKSKSGKKQGDKGGTGTDANATDADLSSDSKYLSSTERYFAVQHRLFVSHWRNAPMNLTRFILMIGLSIMFGLIYLQLAPADDFGSTTSLLGVIFLSLIFPCNVSAAGPLPTLFRQRAVYYRELTAGLYGYFIFQLSIFIVELPYILACSMLFLVPFYFMIGFPNDAALFFKYFVLLFLMFLFYSSLLTLWLAAVPSQVVANIMMGLCNSLFFVFGGLLLSPNLIPSGWKWFYYIDPIPKAFNPIALSLFECNGGAAAGCPMLQQSADSDPIPIYQFLQTTLAASPSDFGKDLGYLVLEIGVLRIFILLAFRFISHIKR